MYKQMKLWFILTLSVIIVLTGCSGNSGNKEETANKGESGNTETATNAPEVEKPVTIKVHTFGNEASYNWEKTIAAFKEKYPNIIPEVIVLSEKGDTQEALQKLDL